MLMETGNGWQRFQTFHHRDLQLAQAVRFMFLFLRVELPRFNRMEISPGCLKGRKVKRPLPA